MLIVYIRLLFIIDAESDLDLNPDSTTQYITHIKSLAKLKAQ